MTLQSLINACGADESHLRALATESVSLWEPWLKPLADTHSVGEDPTYNDAFQQMQEEMNRLSGADTALICALAEQVLTTEAKDIRVAVWYCWARLQRDGEEGFADGLALLAGLLQRFGDALHPQRARSHEAALGFPASARVLDTLTLYPEVTTSSAQRTVAALLVIEDVCGAQGGIGLGGLYGALEARLLRAGGPDAVVPQTASDSPESHSSSSAAPMLAAISSGRDLLDQARTLAAYLRDQPGGWLAAHRLMKTIRHDTLSQLPPLSGDGKSRIEPPKPDQRAQLKRLWLQQSWAELAEQADSLFSRGGNHFWLDLQWYQHQAQLRSGNATLAAIVQDDLKGLLSRLNGLETLAFSDGTPFADEVTLGWIQQHVLMPADVFGSKTVSVPAGAEDDVLQLESEATGLADREGIEAALAWLQQRPGITSPRQQWLLRLLMARIAEQFGRQEMALHLLHALDTKAESMVLSEWEPSLLFEVKSRRLKLLRSRAGRSEADKTRIHTEMERLLSSLISIDAARAAILTTS
ncbi:type VI secretion system protein TssA [Erwinia sp. S59]|uniref:type VI secretion system protein TssA n=1 Tax=Erwinia sp. S59 TaxID=2769340 RepID=UPI00190DA986|nr:type VI secretion system protein TssA [Erwinia sp. S59]MBK0090096.1 type VI secretion system protein TssA [Erwinia sp. S59]